MNLNDIILPKSIIAEIYKNNIVDIIADTPKTNLESAPEATSQLQFLGKNQKNIVVLVNYDEVVHLPDEHLDFLSKILIACRLDIGDIAIINTSRQQANREDIKVLDPKSMLIFGECNSDIPHINPADFFTPITYDSCSVVTAPALEKLYKSTAEGKQLKSKLWASLQQLFKL